MLYHAVFVLVALVAVHAAPTDCDRPCQLIYQPVCGSDGKTYDNQCEFDVANCGDPNLQKAHDGECKTRRGLNLRGNKAGEDNCRWMCDRSYNPVCGSDGLTYANPCVFAQAVCIAKSKGHKLTEAYKGVCKQQVVRKEACTKPCNRMYEPVCGTDAVTYGNQCLLDIAICESGKLALDYKGECCPPMCPMHLLPVCGTNGVTYNNECELNYDSCKSVKRGGEVIKVEHGGFCKSV